MRSYYIIIFVLIVPLLMQADQKQVNSDAKPKHCFKNKQRKIKKILIPLIASVEFTPLVYSTLALLFGSLITIKPEEVLQKPFIKEDFEQKD